jgi:hypothetical protein
MGKSRALSIVVATAAATLVTGMTSAPAGAASDPAPAKSGAAWLSDQVTDGLVHNEQYDFDDVGLSIDVALGLDAAGKKPAVVKEITKAVSKNVAFYTAFAPSVYAGPTAKAAVLALSQDKNPHAFGGVDLVAQLEDRVATAAPITGRIEDAFDPTDQFAGDYANVIGQAYAAQALSLVRSAKATSAAAFLLSQQCNKGYFRQYFTVDKTRADQSCQGAPRSERGASTDATALAVLALQDVKGSKAKGAVKKAVAWLEDTQLGSGAFTDTGKSSGATNTNSTGLAGWALGAAGEAGAASAAAVAVRTLQVSATNPCSGKLAEAGGAVAYDVTAYEDGLVKGIKAKTSDQWRRASAQALPVLQWAPRGSGALTASGPAGTVSGGDTFSIALTGVAPGQRVCVARGAESFEFVPGRKAITKVTLQAPHGTATRTYAVHVGGTKLDVAVRVAG